MELLKALLALLVRAALLYPVLAALPEPLGRGAGSLPALAALALGALLLTARRARPLGLTLLLDRSSRARALQRHLLHALGELALLLGLAALLSSVLELLPSVMLVSLLATALEVLRPRQDPSGPVASPGEVWWASVPFEESRGEKDRPCLVIRTRGTHHHVLMLTTRDHSHDERYLEVPLPAREQREGRSRSHLRFDRVIMLPASSLRRRAWRMDPQVLRAVERHHHVRLL